ncbi:MAG TPA: PEP-CTERM sorting domain-containing protein [Candidatus Bathyarchaeia archaeon]|nr:PEP-CTERM sorting domain-containing protein [Candidatus Bathyarchaeia archaeon]
MSLKRIALLAAVLATASLAANAAVIDLTFENIASYPWDSSSTYVLEYYNGGTSSVGTTGPNYGVSFPDNALNICLNTLGTVCSNTSRGGLGDPNSQLGALFFLSGSNTYVNVAAGFTTGFSFYYTAINFGGSVNVWSGLNGTGTLLATLNLPTTPSGPCNGYNAGFCPFYPIGVSFAGTAMSIDFGGVANQIVFDDVTFGSATPGTPEPGTLVMFGSGLLGVAGMLRRKFFT